MLTADEPIRADPMLAGALEVNKGGMAPFCSGWASAMVVLDRAKPSGTPVPPSLRDGLGATTTVSRAPIWRRGKRFGQLIGIRGDKAERSFRTQAKN
jgi:hypothetical protein